MRRRLAAAAVALAALGAVVVGLGAGGDDGAYRVRAIFDNAAFLIAGEDVKIAGAKVGVVESLDITPERKAAIVLRIDDPGFQDFRADATCAVRPQSLIGEKLIDCQPTQPRPEGTPPPPPLEKIEDGRPGAGQFLLPVENTTTPVDPDLLNNIMRRPYRERFAIILSELGVGLAARGEDLNEVVRRANPALREVNAFFKILAEQNRTLARLARDGDRVLKEWADKRKEFADFIVQANTASQATAERRADLERIFEKFPELLRQLRANMRRLGAFSEQAGPVASDLRKVGPEVSRILVALGPFSRNGTPALQSLGDMADIGRVALAASEPLFGQLRTLGSRSRSVASNLRKLTSSIKKTDTIERAMDVFFGFALSLNGFDEAGHYARSHLIVTNCANYTVTPLGGCEANFIKGAGSSAGSGEARSSSGASATQRVLAGEDPDQALGRARRGRTGGSRPPKRSADRSGTGRATRSNKVLLDYLLGAGR